MPGEGIAAGLRPGAAGGDRAEHGACPDRLESSDRPEGGDGVAHPDRSQDALDAFHPVANVWPLLPERELQELADDIVANGLHNPIVRHRDGRIVDGRNRWLACRMAGVDCPSSTYEGQDGPALVAFVVSLNDKRRHLTTDQRAAIAAELATLAHGSNRHEAKVEAPNGASTAALTDAAAAKLMGVGERSVERAKAVKRADPELHARVKRGEVKAGRARAEIARKRGRAGVAAKKTTSRAMAAAPPGKSPVASAPNGPARPPGTPKSGQELFEKIVALRKESDTGDPIARLNELRSLDRHAGRRLELLDAHIDAQARFLAGLRSLRERLGREAAAGEAGA